jgi:sulfoxide reductase heme-binding subunit YedZ
VFVAALLPVAFFINDYVSGALPRPWLALVDVASRWPIRFLILGLCLTPAASLTRLDWLRDFRRILILFGVFYAGLHFLAWVRQYGYDVSFIAEEVTFRLSSTVGFISLLLLVPVTATLLTVTHRLVAALRWQYVQWLIYLSVAAGLIHYAMMTYFGGKEIFVHAGLLLFCVAWQLWPRRKMAAASASARFGGRDFDERQLGRRRAKA